MSSVIAPAGCPVRSADGTAVRLHGRLDVTTVAEARELLHETLEAGPEHLVVDLAGVELLDAAGLAMLVATHRRCQQRGQQLLLVEVPPRLWRLFAATRLTRVLSVHPQAASA